MTDIESTRVGIRQWWALYRLCDASPEGGLTAREVAKAAYGARWSPLGMDVVRALISQGMAEHIYPHLMSASGVPWPLTPEVLVRITAKGELARLRPMERTKLYRADAMASRAFKVWRAAADWEARTA